MRKLLYGGTCSAGGWHMYNPIELVLMAYDNDCNLIGIELLGPLYHNKSIGPRDIVNYFIKLWRCAKALNIKLFIHGINFNDIDEIKITQSQIDDLFFRIGGATDCILVPVVEGDDNSKFARLVYDSAAKFFRGELAYNGSGRPMYLPSFLSPIRYKYIDYHSQNINDHGPNKSGLSVIIDTDNWPMISSLTEDVDKQNNFWSTYKIVNLITDICNKSPHVVGLSCYCVEDGKPLKRLKSGMTAFKNKVNVKKSRLNYLLMRYLNYVP